MASVKKTQRWNFENMLAIGKKLFAKINKRKHSAHHNHEVHFLARELDDWLQTGIESLINGTYTPRHLKRYYFADEMVDQLHIADRVLQHILLQQLKPAFKYIMSPNVYHLVGPTGVRYATEKIRRVLQEEKPQFVLRIDIKSYYKSVSHHRLLNDIKEHFDDPNVITMLENIIKNPIETPRGTSNPDSGIALRGPLSQFFSGLFLKKLDDAFERSGVAYLRYQDDCIILCKTERQLKRCKRRMMEILHERGLSLSRKKSYIGSINKPFHFLGIHYFPTQPENKITVTQANDASENSNKIANSLDDSGGGSKFLDINQVNLFVLFPIREHYEEVANRSKIWSPMLSLC